MDKNHWTIARKQRQTLNKHEIGSKEYNATSYQKPNM